MAIKVWVIALVKEYSGPQEIVYYYNHFDDIWQRECIGACLFFGEKECDEKLNELRIFGAEKITGSVD